MPPRVELYTAHDLSPVQQEVRRGNESGKHGPVPKHCVVTGGLGFVGQRLVETLVERGAERVVSFDIVPPPANVWQHKAIQYITGDIRDLNAVVNAFQGADCIWHLAAAVGPFLPKYFYHDINVVGTQNVIEACKRQGVRKVVFSSTPSSRYTQDEVDGLTEADMPDIPQKEYVAEYAGTKAEGEVLLRKACSAGDLLFIAVAPDIVYGPRDNLYMPNFLEAGGSGLLRVLGNSKARVGYTHVDNYCHGLIITERQLYDGSPHLRKFYIITDGSTHPDPRGFSVLWDDLDRAVSGMGFTPLSAKFAWPYWAVRSAAFVNDSISAATGMKFKLTGFSMMMVTTSHWFRIDAAQRDLSYEPIVSYREGWPDMIEWFRKKWLPSFNPKSLAAMTGGLAQQSRDKNKLQDKLMGGAGCCSQLACFSGLFKSR